MDPDDYPAATLPPHALPQPRQRKKKKEVPVEYPWKGAWADDKLRELVAAVQENPEDLTGYKVAADRADELGHPALGHALRWMGGRDKRPVKRRNIKRRPYMWYLRGSYRMRERPAHDRPLTAALESTLWQACRSPHHYGLANFATWEAAVDWLAAGLEVLRKHYETDI